MAKAEDDQSRACRRLEAAERVLRGDRVRWLLGKKRELVATGNVFQKTMTDVRFERLMDEISHTELERELLMMELEKGPRAVPQLAEATGIPGPAVFRHIVMLMKARRVEARGEHEGLELFGAVDTGVKK